MAISEIILLLVFSRAAFGVFPNYALQNVLENSHGSSLYNYPTDFTRDIIPVSLLVRSATVRRLLTSFLETSPLP